MNRLRNRLGSDYESVLADAIAIVIAALLVAAVWIVVDTVRAEEPPKSNVCRNEFGHRVECSQ